MNNPPHPPKMQLSANHRRVISVRLRLLEESCLRLLDLSRNYEATLTSRRALPQDRAREVKALVDEVRAKISQMVPELGLERAHLDARREANALVAAIATDIEELDPHSLRGYGAVPEPLTEYLNVRTGELLETTKRIGDALKRG